ncbi:hypothetical protein NHX12_002601 [Muraenolepis orangiensis]|uniref:Uncharacterized protein n=1 Tax=Muraenolepis orangiensis TaxID=630683 RepID=A0A9Q0E153_9TELE|nr:hypothetical protein NHX12_002601 [Muraenolepis orangiensis]
MEDLGSYLSDLGSYLSDPDSPDRMNQACFLFDEFDDTTVPETPSPRGASGVGVVDGSPSGGAVRRSKRRRGQHGEALLENLLGSGSPSEAHCNLALGGGRLGPPLPSGRFLDGLLESVSRPPLETRPVSGVRRAGRPRGQTRTSGPGAAVQRPPATSLGGASLSFLTAEEKLWVDGELTGPPTGQLEVVCFSDEEDAVIRSLQLEEDEAMARSLQDQFDREETRPHQRVNHHLSHENRTEEPHIDLQNCTEEPHIDLKNRTEEPHIDLQNRTEELRIDLKNRTEEPHIDLQNPTLT